MARTLQKSSLRLVDTGFKRPTSLAELGNASESTGQPSFELQRPRFALFTAVQFWHRKMARNQKGTNRLQLCAHSKGCYKWADVLKKLWKCYTHSIFCHCIIFMDPYMSPGSHHSKKLGLCQLRTKKVRANLALDLVVPGGSVFPSEP